LTKFLNLKPIQPFLKGIEGGICMTRNRTVMVTAFTLVLFGVFMPVLTWITNPKAPLTYQQFALFLIPCLLLALLLLIAPHIPASRLALLSAFGLAGLGVGALTGWIQPTALALYAVGGFGLNLVPVTGRPDQAERAIADHE
jgi:hypothetical protein